DLLFVGLAVVALVFLRGWNGVRGRAAGLVVSGVTALSLAFAVASPALPIDPIVTRLAVGRTLEDLGLAGKAPAPAEGRHLVVLLDVTDPGAAQIGARLNEAAERGAGIVALTPATPEETAAFLWAAAPAFDLIAVDRPVLKRLYRSLPRYFLI